MREIKARHDSSTRHPVFALLLLLVSAQALALTQSQARHLVSRTGFGVTAEEIERLEPMSQSQAVDYLLDQAATGSRTNAVPPPVAALTIDRPDKKFRQMSQAERKALRKQRRKKMSQLKGWWYQQMIETQAPLRERMVLFWHNHFTTAAQKVKQPALLYQQNELFREHALGNFADLLHAIVKDPAMVLYLDNQSNKKGKPNENFARELLELFTLGEGNYSEHDIKEAARAFTGWRVKRKTGVFVKRKRQHDDGIKTFLGVTGNLDGEDIVDEILRQPRTAEFISEKLWRSFVSVAPDEDRIKQLAQVFRSSGYEIKPLLRAILTAPEFSQQTNIGSLIKSPVELIVGSVRLFQLPVENPAMLARAGRKLGQDIFNPPNVKGWPGGEAWITADSLLQRQQLIERMLRGKEMAGPGRRKDSPRMGAMMSASQSNSASKHMTDWMAQQENDRGSKALQQLVLPIAPVNPVPSQGTPRERLSAWLLDPAYQLK